MNNRTKLQTLINSSHDKSLSEQTGSVWQVWHDGEITLQKSGSLLWERSLHGIHQPIQPISNINWPNELNSQGFIFCTEENAKLIRELIRTTAIEDIKAKP